MSSDQLLIIGAGAEQVPLYRRARDMGLSVVGTDADPDAPALRLANHSIIASTRSPEETLHALSNFDGASRIAGVMTIANDVPKTVSKVALQLGLPGLPLDVAETLSDKSEMKTKFMAGAIETPRQWTVEPDWNDVFEFEGRDCDRYVVKPTDGRGSVGVLIARHREEIPGLIRRSASLSGSDQFVIEEYLEGRQYSVEGIVVNSRFHLSGVAERNYDRLELFAPHVIEDGGDISESQDLSAIASFSSVMQRVTDELGLEFGPLKGDLVVDSGGIVQVIEVAGRLSGGWFASHQIPFASGVDLMGLSILQALGERIPEEDLLPSQNRATSIRYWFPPPGRILHMSGLEAIRRSEGVLHCDIFRQVGEIQPQIRKHSDRFGFVLTGAQNIAQAKKLNEEAMSLLKLEISE